MTKPWHSTWSRMRASRRIGGMWLGELRRRLAEDGVLVTPYEIRQACIAQGLWPPPKAYGHFDYQESHLEAVRAYAARRDGMESQEKEHGLAAG